MDEKKSRDDEYHPTPKKFKADPENGHKNDSMESSEELFNFSENIRASTSTVSSDNIRASNNLSTEAGKIPVIQL